MAQQWYSYPIGHGYLTNYAGPGTDTPHYADDVETPFHTPITALLSGTVKQADYAVWSGQPGGGEVFIEPDAGGPEYYFYHLDELDVSNGQHVSAGQVVGLSGGQNSGGEHPVSPMWSSGPHTHVGYFQQYVQTPAGGRPFGPDITPLLQNATPGNPLDSVQSLGSSGSNQPLSSSGSCLGIGLPGGGCAGIPVSMPSTSQLYRGGFIIVGLLLIFFGLKHFIGSGPNIKLSLPEIGEDQTKEYTSGVAKERKAQQQAAASEQKANARASRAYLKRGATLAPPPPSEAA